MLLIFFPMSIIFNLHLEFNKLPCYSVAFHDQGPLLSIRSGWVNIVVRAVDCYEERNFDA